MSHEATKFYIRTREDLPENEMFFYARRGFSLLGVETVPFTWGDDIVAMEDLGPTVGISGYIGDVRTGLRKLGRPIPAALDYPEPLKPFLGRRIWESSLGAVRSGIDTVFVKPHEQKLFTGFVWSNDIASRMRTFAFQSDTPVWCAEVVDFVSEWRSFVLRQEVLDCRPYRGDWSVAPTKAVVTEAVAAMGPGAPAAYALDWGVTRDGRTLLIEQNDATALGHYGLNPVSYARMLSARWYELAGGGS